MLFLVLYHLHTRPLTLCKTVSRSPVPTLILCSILYHILIASLIENASNRRWPQQQWPKQVVDVDKLYTPDSIVVLRLLYPYRLVILGSNKHNGDDAP